MSTALDNERKTAPGEMNYDACGRQRKLHRESTAVARSKTLVVGDEQLWFATETS